MESGQTFMTFPDCQVDGSSSSPPLVNATQTDTYDVLGLPERRMPPRQTPTTFPDCLGNRFDFPHPLVKGIQTNIRRSRTAKLMEVHLLHLW